MFLGDFNAACGYVAKKNRKNIRLLSDPSFIWLIQDNVDTTVKDSTDCAYDRYANKNSNHHNKIMLFMICTYVCTAYGQPFMLAQYFTILFMVNPQNCCARRAISQNNRTVISTAVQFSQGIPPYRDGGKPKSALCFYFAHFHVISTSGCLL